VKTSVSVLQNRATGVCRPAHLATNPRERVCRPARLTADTCEEVCRPTCKGCIPKQWAQIRLQNRAPEYTPAG